MRTITLAIGTRPYFNLVSRPDSSRTCQIFFFVFLASTDRRVFLFGNMVVMSLLHNQVCTGAFLSPCICNSLRIFGLGGHQARMCRESSLLAGLERRCRQTAWGGGPLIVAFPWYSGELGRPSRLVGSQITCMGVVWGQTNFNRP